MDRFIKVDMGLLEINEKPIPSRYERDGGRLLIAKYLLDNVDPLCEPLGPHNILIFTPGILAGLPLSSAGRMSVGGKSPLTGGIKESNVGGTPGDKLGHLGIRAIIVESIPPEGDFSLLHISKKGAELISARDLEGLGTYETLIHLQEIFDRKVAILCIGPAGEMELAGAGIAATDDLLLQPGRMAARGGLGAVMGSKGLKAIVIDDSNTSKPKMHDPDLFFSSAKRFSKELLESPKTGREGSMHRFGTAAIMSPVNEIGALPTRNFSEGQFEAIEEISPEKLRRIILDRGGKVGERCMAGCVLQCSNEFKNEDGKTIVSTLQYETLAMMGSNLGLKDLDTIAHLNRHCNDLGLDTIEMGAAIGVAMDAGLYKFGDGEAALHLMDEIRQGSVLGRVIGNGAAVAGRVLGVKRIPVARGQAFPGYDPRALKGNGVTYATTAMGADHTAGNTIGSRIIEDPLSVKGKGKLSRDMQLIAALLDFTGLCLFVRPPLIADPSLMVDLIDGRYGWGWSVEDSKRVADEILHLEREFNRKAGYTSTHDRLPSIFAEEQLPPHNAVFDVPVEELERATQDL